MWMYRYLLETLLSILWDIYQEVRLLDHMVVLIVIFWWIVILFSKLLHHFTIPLTACQGSNLSTFSPTLVIFWFCLFVLIVVILVGMRWYLTVVAIYIEAAGLLITSLSHWIQPGLHELISLYNFLKSVWVSSVVATRILSKIPLCPNVPVYLSTEALVILLICHHKSNQAEVFWS